MRINEVSWMTGDMRTKVTGRGEEGVPQKDRIDFRNSVEIFF